MGRTNVITAFTLAAALAACSDANEPTPFDATTTDAKTQAVLRALDGNTALASLAVLGPYMSGIGTASAALALAPFDPTGMVSGVEGLRTLQALQPSFSTAPSLAIFPANLLGQTFVFDPDSARYVVDPSATGAPASGIRLVLYAVDPVLGQILQPLQPIGTLDLIDVSTPASDAVRLLAVIGGVTYLDYTAGTTVTTSTVTLAAVGYVSNGTDRIDFDLSVTVDGQSGDFAVDYTLTSTEGAVRLEATFGSSSISVSLRLTGDGNQVLFSLLAGPSTFSGQIEYNGSVVVTIGGTVESPTFTRPDGTALSQDEIASLRAMFDIIDELFDTFDDLLFPAALVLAIA